MYGQGGQFFNLCLSFGYPSSNAKLDHPSEGSMALLEIVEAQFPAGSVSGDGGWVWYFNKFWRSIGCSLQSQGDFLCFSVPLFELNRGLRINTMAEFPPYD